MYSWAGKGFAVTSSTGVAHPWASGCPTGLEGDCVREPCPDTGRCLEASVEMDGRQYSFFFPFNVIYLYFAPQAKPVYSRKTQTNMKKEPNYPERASLTPL